METKKEDIFYPNNLKESDLKDLNGWKLKVSVLHFGKYRSDCVTIGYGYEYRPEKYSDSRPDYTVDEDNTIIMVADKDGLYAQPVSLRNEIDWNDSRDLLAECGIELKDVFIKYIKSNICD